MSEGGPVGALLVGVLALFALATPGAGRAAPASGDPSGGWTTIQPGGATGCALGTPFQFHVKPGRADRLLVFFNGGGACWTGEHCDPAREPTPYVPVADNAHNDPRQLGGIFGPERAVNPLHEWTQVFVPYCTGDVHLGSRDVSYPTAVGTTNIHHRGRFNAQAALDWTYRNLATPERILVAGGSAGAIAAPWYATEIAAHYPAARLAVLGDGAGGYREPGVAALLDNWGAFAGLAEHSPFARLDPATATFEDIWRTAAAALPDATYAQFDNAYDAVQEGFLRLLGNPSRLYPLLESNRADLEAALPRFYGFTAAGTAHTLVRYDRLYTSVEQGLHALDWLAALAEGRPMRSVTCGSAEACAMDRPPVTR